MIYGSFEELIGKTPLLELKNIEKDLGLEAKVLAKLEYLNPAGSAKDRAALYMINEAEKSGKLKKGGVIIEPTSGNTGIGLAAIGACRGYRAIIVMPDTMSIERRMLMSAYGAELVLSDGKKGMAGAIELANEIAAKTPGSMIAGQFENPANAKAHFETTGPEIYADTNGKTDVFVAGVGTGGTLTGVGRFLKSKDPKIEIVAVEPENSAVLSGGSAGAHGLQGIGAGFVPSLLDTSVYDRVETVSDEEAYKAGRMLARREGILCGISSGAALSAALKLAADAKYKGKNIVVLLPDTGDRYLSTPLFAEN